MNDIPDVERFLISLFGIRNLHTLESPITIIDCITSMGGGPSCTTSFVTSGAGSWHVRTVEVSTCLHPMFDSIGCCASVVILSVDVYPVESTTNGSD